MHNFHAVRRELYTRYGHRADLHVIDTVLDDTIAEHTATARITAFLPILVQREAAERIEAHIEAPAGRRILFSGRANSARAVLAAALARRLSGNAVVATVADTHPENRHDTLLEWVMDERCLDTDGVRWTQPTGGVLDAADVVVYLDSSEAVDQPGRAYVRWDVGATDGFDLDAARAFADDMEQRVTALLTDLGVPVRTPENARS